MGRIFQQKLKLLERRQLGLAPDNLDFVFPVFIVLVLDLNHLDFDPKLGQ